MTDRELLELAAKAAGLNIKSYAVDTDDAFIHLIVGRKFTSEKVAWNPLTDDGDALRLAVKLGLVVDTKPARTYCGTTSYSSIEDHNDDPCAATRRAIVRAASEMGKEK